METVCRALEAADVVRTKAGARHVLRVPAVRELAAHPALVRLAGTFIGAPIIPYRATLFDKSATSNWLVAWHQDTALPLEQQVGDPAWGPWSLKGGVMHAIAPASALETIVALRVHLDDSTHANGPLRVLAGSHRGGILPHAEIQRLANSIRPTECVADRGGVVAMRPLLVHASSKASEAQSRRVLHIEYATSVHLAAGIKLAVG
jgi:ectoine hydroxylase-related dioxygenase (phytanoyl-CoA dioxygenase family)